MCIFPVLCKRTFTVIYFFLIFCVPALGATMANPALVIIPKPARIEIRPGGFKFNLRTQIYLETDNEDAHWVGEYLSALLSRPMGHTIPVLVVKSAGQHRDAIVLSLKGSPTLGPEDYEMSVSRDAIRISAPKVAGLFYGVQTLRQMLPPEVESSEPINEPLKVPCARIEDRPRFAWRGLMLDCSRTFLSMEYLRRTVDRMALYKLNVLHLHLTDDQGWRLEIKKYPELTTVGAHFAGRFGGGGGFYTQQEMRDLIAYARERNVSVVPEIEIPGHSLEVLAAYPALACPLPETQTFEVVPYWEGSLHHSQPLCVCNDNDKVFEMYQDILSEVIDLFPSEFIHVGGDEVPKDTWNKSPLCEARMKAEGLKNAEELQSYFMKRMAKVVVAKGRRMIGWDEIIEGGLAPGATVMSWRGTKGGIAAADLGHDVVMTPGTYTYLDYNMPMDMVYSYDPAVGFTDAMARHILGMEACMWTHIAVTERTIDFQIYPRLLALAEAGWSQQQNREWSDFHARLVRQFPRLERMGVTYNDPRAVGKKLGSWREADLSGDAPRVFDWDATPWLGDTGEVEVQVRWDSGLKSVHVRSVLLLEDGKEISRVVFPGPLNKRIDLEVGWLSLGTHRPGSRYTVRVTLQGTKEGASAGSVWVMGPRAAGSSVRR